MNLDRWNQVPGWGKILLILWFLQMSWWFWHFAPEGRDIAQRLWAYGGRGSQVQADPLDFWLAELARLLPPASTYIFVDCYETGNYARMRYVLHPRRQIRLEPKTSPAFLFDQIRQHGADYVILGGCNLAPQWQFLLSGDQPVFRPLATSGAGLVFTVDSAKVVGGYYD